MNIKEKTFAYLSYIYDIYGIYDVYEESDWDDRTITTTILYAGGIKEINASLAAILGVTE